MLLDDFQDREGDWVPYVVTQTKSLIWTTCGRLWYSMNARCKVDGNVQRKWKSYQGSNHKFKSFNHFAEWAQKQVGFGKDKFHLDKDLLFKGNKTYSPETCVFIPQCLNVFASVNAKSMRGKFPVGVSKASRCKSFVAYCNNEDSIRTHLGSFKTPEDAFLAYKMFKENVAKLLAERWRGSIDIRVHNALLNFKVEISS